MTEFPKDVSFGKKKLPTTGGWMPRTYRKNLGVIFRIFGLRSVKKMSDEQN